MFIVIHSKLSIFLLSEISKKKYKTFSNLKMEPRLVTRKSTLESELQSSQKVPKLLDPYNSNKEISTEKTQTFELGNLPDEVTLKILSYLSMKELINCGQVAKRIRAISHDETLWRKVNLHRKPWQLKTVPTEFLEMILNNGCKHLTLKGAKLVGNLGLDKTSHLSYLDLEDCEASSDKVFEDLIASCYSLEKLSLPEITLTSKFVKKMCYQNGKTLQILNLCNCVGLNLESMKHIADNCTELREVDFSFIPNGTCARIPQDAWVYLANNLTPKIKKLDLCGQKELKDEHGKALVSRCNKITDLDLYGTSISNLTLMSIIGNLKLTLEKLKLPGWQDIHYVNLIQLKSFSRLRRLDCILHCNCCDFKSLKKQLPHVSINPQYELLYLDASV